MSAKTAKVFAIRIRLGSLGNDRRLTPEVRPACLAATSGALCWPVQRAEVDQRVAAIPKEGGLGQTVGLVPGVSTFQAAAAATN